MLGSKIKMVRRFLAALFTIFAMSEAAAQAAEKAKPGAYIEARLFHQPILHVDGQKYETGWFENRYTSAASAFDAKPNAAREFKEYLSAMEKSNYVLWGTVGTSLTFVVADLYQWHLPDHERNLAYNAILIAGVSAAIHYISSGYLHFSKALNIYNGFETGEKSDASGLKLSLAPVLVPGQSEGGSAMGGGLALNVDF